MSKQNLKIMSRRGLAMLLALVLCFGMVNHSVYAMSTLSDVTIEDEDVPKSGFMVSEEGPASVPVTDEESDSDSVIDEEKPDSDSVLPADEPDGGVADHVHNEDGWICTPVRELTCEIEEHIHTEECFAPIEADSEEEAETRETIEKEETKKPEETTKQEESKKQETSENIEKKNDSATPSDASYAELIPDSEEETEEETKEETEEETLAVVEEEPADEEEAPAPRKLICGMEESKGHVHSKDCYVERKVLICDQEETGDVVHVGDNGVVDMDNPDSIVTEGHHHDDSCYKVEKVLVCGMEEGEGAHVHTEECYLPEGMKLICGKTAHVHSEECYSIVDWDCVQAEEEEVGENDEEIIISQGGNIILSEESYNGGKIVTEEGDTSAHEIVVHGEWHGTIELKGSGDVTICGNGTIDATDQDSSAIIVQNGTLILEGDVTITGGNGTIIQNTGIVGMATDDTTNGFSEIIANRGQVKCGGGILLLNKSKLEMRNGTIQNNNADQGGGICAFRGTNVKIYGGSIRNNTANKYAGGGMFLAGNGNEIDPTSAMGKDVGITIFGNITKTLEDLGGGGIFLETKGTLSIKNAIISRNTAYGLGGGVAGCLHGMVSVLTPETAAIYSNTLCHENGIKSLNNIVDHGDKETVWTDSLKNDAVDYFVAGYSQVGSHSLGGGIANWSGTALRDKTPATDESVNTEKGLIEVEGLLGLHVNNCEEVEKAAQTVDPITNITNNISYMHGGGIGTNGLLTFGEADFSYSDTVIAIKAKKAMILPADISIPEDAEVASKGNYEFNLMNEDGTILGTATSNKDGDIIFTNIRTLDLFGGVKEKPTNEIVNATLILQEVYEDKPSVDYDIAVRKINISARRNVEEKKVSTEYEENGETPKQRANSKIVYVIYDTIISANVIKVGDTVSVPATVNENVITIPDTVKFANVANLGGFSVTKKVTGGGGDKNKYFHFTVTLPDDKSINGMYGGMTFASGVARLLLKDGDTVTAEGLPAGIKYEITEDEANQNGYQTIPSKAGGTVKKDEVLEFTFMNFKPGGSLTITKTAVDDPKFPADVENHTYSFKVKVSGNKLEMMKEQTYPFAVYNNKFTGGKGDFVWAGIARVQEDGTLLFTWKGEPVYVEETKEYVTPTHPDLRFVGSKIVVIKDLPLGAVFEVEENVTEAEIDKYTLTVKAESSLSSASIGSLGEKASGLEVSEGKNNPQVNFTNEYTRDLGSLTIKKVVSVSGEAPTEITDNTQEYTFNISGPPDADGDYFTNSDGIVTFTQGEATVTITGPGEVTIRDLPTGKYKIEEGQSDIDGYTLGVTGTGGVTVTKGETTQRTVTNTYTKKTGSLQITKNVSGIGQEADEMTFTFTVTGPGGYNKTVKVHGGETVTLDPLNPGEYTVTEQDASIPGMRWSSTGTGGVTVHAGETAGVVITNTYIPDRPDNPDTPDTPGTPDRTTFTPNRPVTEMPDNQTPRSDMPDQPMADIPDDNVPLGDMEQIPDDDVPLAFLAPMTGDETPFGIAAFLAVIASGLMGLFGALGFRKKEEKD